MTIPYPVGTKVQCGWAKADEGEAVKGVVTSWKRVPIDQGVVGTLQPPKPQDDNRQRLGYVWVRLDPEQSAPVNEFSPGGWEDEGEYWRVLSSLDIGTAGC